MVLQRHGGFEVPSELLPLIARSCSSKGRIRGPSSFPTMQSVRAAGLLALTLLAAVAVLVYQPGLRGPFLFDDFANLPALGAYGPVDDARTFWLYLTSGTADPTGRPLALLTFLLDANDWPALPGPFKRTNLVLHVMNGVLLYALLGRWGRLVTTPGPAVAAALFATAAWLLHPLFVSTTLYVVQREAMLPATFILLGLLGLHAGWMRAREGMARGPALAASALLACTALGVASKANGALLPAFAWLVANQLHARFAPISDPSQARAMRRTLVVTAVLPTLLLAFALGTTALNTGGGMIEGRGWTLGQRLLTEARVIWSYLAQLAGPTPYRAGLFNDDWAVSRSLVQPWTTAPAVAGVLAMVVAATLGRRRYPAASLALGFFLVGHVLESTVIPLELYFEHRNYVPALVLFWPIGLSLARPVAEAGTPTGAIARKALLVVIPLVFAAITWARSSFWGDGLEQARVWADLSPDSPRAQTYAASQELDRGRIAAAIARVDPALRRRPSESQLALTLVRAECLYGVVSQPALERAAYALRTTPTLGPASFDSLSSYVAQLRSPACRGLDRRAVGLLVDSMAANPRLRSEHGRRQDLFELRARLAMIDGRPARAIALFRAARREDPRPEVGLAQASMLADAGYACDARRYLHEAARPAMLPRARPSVSMRWLHEELLRRWYWPGEFARLDRSLAAEAGEHCDVP